MLLIFIKNYDFYQPCILLKNWRQMAQWSEWNQL